jgi:hypothetical protein
MPLPASTSPPHAFHPLREVLDLGQALPQDPLGHISRRGRAAPPQQLQPLCGSLRLEHDRFDNGAHAHPLGEEPAQVVVGGGGCAGCLLISLGEGFASGGCRLPGALLRFRGYRWDLSRKARPPN